MIKTLIKTTSLIAVFGVALNTGFDAEVAWARNTGVENELKNDPDLSSFYQALVNTGVINELRSNTAYTIFAPTNQAMATLTEAQYPCLYTTQCEAGARAILRNHIAEGRIDLGSPGSDDLFDLNNQHIAVAEPYAVGSPSRTPLLYNLANKNTAFNDKGGYTVDGSTVLYEHQSPAGTLVKISGVIATPQQLADVSLMRYNFAETDMPGQTTTVRETERQLPVHAGMESDYSTRMNDSDATDMQHSQ